MDDKTTILNETMNLCHFESQRRRNVFIRLISDHWLEHVSFKLKCPFKKGYYEIPEHEKMNETDQSRIYKYIPSFVKVARKFQINIGLHTRVIGNLENFLKIRDFYTVNIR